MHSEARKGSAVDATNKVKFKYKRYKRPSQDNFLSHQSRLTIGGDIDKNKQTWEPHIFLKSVKNALRIRIQYTPVLSRWYYCKLRIHCAFTSVALRNEDAVSLSRAQCPLNWLITEFLGM